MYRWSRATAFAIVFTFFVLPSARPLRAAITPEARAVVDRFLVATGGIESIRAIRSVRQRASITALGLTGSTTIWTRQPDHRATDTELGPLKILEGCDGTSAWRTDPGSGKLVSLDGKDLEDALASTYFDNERWLADDQGGGTVTLIGIEEDSTGSFDLLEVSPPAGRSRRLYFDRTTGLIVRATTQKDHMTIVSTFSDYREIHGRRVPFDQWTRIIGMPANDLHLVVDSLWVNEALPDARFAPPESGESAAQYLKEPGLARIPFQYDSRHVWLRVSVDGGEPVDFLYDTGASITVLDSAYATRIGLATEGSLQGQGAASVGSASFARLHSVRIEAPDGDGVEVADLKVAVLSINSFLAPFFWRDAAGVVGFDLISRFVSEIDFDRELLTLHDPATFEYAGSGERIPFTLAGTVPVVRMTIDGVYDGEFRVDVGSSSTVDLHRPYVERHGLAQKIGHSIEVIGGGFGGTFGNRLTRMRKIEIGPYSWERPIVSLSGAEAGAFASEDYAGNIGTRILERFRCTIDYEHRVLYLEPSESYGKPDRITRAGVQLARYGETVMVMQVLEGSPAAEAKLEVNDVVLEVDGKPVLAFTPDTLAELFDHGSVGRTVRFKIARGGKNKQVALRLRDIL